MLLKLAAFKFSSYVILVTWSLICIFPIYWLAVTSIKGESDVDREGTFLPFLNFQPNLDAWRFILGDPAENLVTRFINSIVIGAASTTLTILATCLAIYATTRFPRSIFRISPAAFLWVVLSTRLLPPVVIALPLYVMAQTTGLLDSRTSLIFIYSAINLPVAVWLLQTIFGVKPSEMEEAAVLDGATHLTILFTILLTLNTKNIFTKTIIDTKIPSVS